jgi:hypothetical protein
MKKAIKGFVSVLVVATLLSGTALAHNRGEGRHGGGGRGDRHRSDRTEWRMEVAREATASAIDRAASSGNSDDIRRATRIGSESARWVSRGWSW